MNDDLISRSELKKALTSGTKDIYEFVCLSRVLEKIDNAPTVPLPDFKEGYKQAIKDGKTNFSRPQGEWIKKVDSVGFVSYNCSECGFELELEDCSDSYYCTHCGAKMKGEEE